MKSFFLRREGVILVVVSPFLLFPTVFVPGTAAALLLLTALWLSQAVVNQQPWPVTPLNGALLLWAAALMVGIVVSADPDLTLPKTTGLLLGLAIMRHMAGGNGHDKRLQWGTAAFFTAGLAMVITGTLSVDWRFEVPLVEAVIGRLPPHLITLPEGPPVGIHMNQLAGALLPYPLIFISLLWGWRSTHYPRLVKVGLIVLTTLLLALLFVTQSRSGWLGLAAGLVSLAIMKLWWSFPRTRRWLAGTGVAATAVFLITAALYTNSDEWAQLWQRPPQDTAVGDLSTLDFRREVWLWGITAVEDFPLTGTGLGTFRRVVAERYPIAVPADFDIAHAHNIVLQVALDTGLPGLVAYMSLLAVTGVIGWRVAGRETGLRPFILGLLAALIALHAYGLGDAMAPGSKPGVVFWLIMGLIAHMNNGD
jgi:putative inorganic carbon (HCO3(-)) transporter